jgi:hypothetical protein
VVGCGSIRFSHVVPSLLPLNIHSYVFFCSFNYYLKRYLNQVLKFDKVLPALFS